MNKTKYSLIVATSIDGKIAAHPDHLSDWTSKEDKDFLRTILSETDVIIVGNTTFNMYEVPLSKRKCIVFTRSEYENDPENDNLTYFNPEKQSIKKYIDEKGFKSVAILGGTQIYSYFLTNNLITDYYLTIEPIIFGQGIDLFKTDDYLAKKLELIEVNKLNADGAILMHYLPASQFD